MTIQLSPAMEKRVTHEAEARGIQPKQLIEDALKAYLEPQPKSTDVESENRRRLRELNQKYKKRNVDFDTALHQARAYARRIEAENADIIELAGKRYSKPQSDQWAFIWMRAS